MNKGSKHYSLLLQEDVESEGLDSIAGEEEEMMIIMAEDDGLCSLVGAETPDTDEETDVDSDEEEIFNSSSRHRTLCNEGSKLNNAISLGRNNEYQLLSNDGQMKSKSLDTPLTTIWTPTPMSPARRACFIASIMFGILVVSMFLWTLPCDVQPCEGDLTLRPKQWFVDISGIGTNHTTLVHRIDGGYDILISFYKFSNLSGWDTTSTNVTLPSTTTLPDCNDSTEVPGSLADQGTETNLNRPCNNNGTIVITSLENQCGVLLFDGEAGRERWRLDLQECPSALYCDLIDSTGDEVFDCLVIGYKSMALMVEPRYGNVLWHVHSQERQKDSSYLGTPLVLLDVDADGFKEILFSEKHFPASGKQSFSQLILVSGKTGLKIGIPFVAHKCSKISSLLMTNDVVTYTCFIGTPENIVVQNISLSKLIETVMSNDPTFVGKKISVTTTTTVAPVQIASKDESNFCIVKVLNKGKCPTCQGLVSIESNNKVLWNQDYGSHSTITDWKHFAHNGKCYGAIVKVWQWHQSTEVYKSVKPHPFIYQRTTRSSARGEDDDNLPAEDELEVPIKTLPIYQPNHNAQIDAHDVVTENPSLSLDNKSASGNVSSETSTPVVLLETPPTFYVKEDQNLWDDNTKSYSVDGESLLKTRSGHGKKRHMSPEPKHGNNPSSSSPLYHKLTKKFYEHPTIHHHHGKQTSYVHVNDESEHVPKSTTQSNYHSESDMTTQELTVPPGFKLQKLDEKLMIILHNSTNWNDKDISKIRVSQLCYNDYCIPSATSHKESILVEPTRDGITTNVFITTTTFTSDRKLAAQKNNFIISPWLLKIYIRKIIIFL